MLTSSSWSTVFMARVTQLSRFAFFFFFFFKRANIWIKKLNQWKFVQVHVFSSFRGSIIQIYISISLSRLRIFFRSNLDKAFLYIYFFSLFPGMHQWRTLPTSAASRHSLIQQHSPSQCKRSMVLRRTNGLHLVAHTRGLWLPGIG